MGTIVVVGSSNIDMVIYSSTLPKPGETVLGGEFLMNPGGKGANQAVAAAKLGDNIIFLTSVGDDIFGTESLANFDSVGIDTSNVKVVNGVATGTALILVDSKGENCISVASGANNHLYISDIEKASAIFVEATHALFQLETPLETVIAGLKTAKSNNCKTILNPAPAQSLSDEILSNVDYITPNETEAEILTGIEVINLASARKAASILRGKGIQTVIITMGKNGAYVLSENLDQLIEAPIVKAVDTTAAGDTFNGALVVALAEGKSTEDAIRFANKAGSISVTRKGAQSSVPSRDEI